MIAVIFNPTARGDKATAFRARLTRATQAAQAQGVSIELRPTRRAGDGVVQAHEAVASGCTTVVAAGGDGTVNEVVNGLARWPDGTDRARLAVLPLGTVNVFAKELGIPTDFDAGWQLLLRGAERRVDLGAVDLLDPDDGGETRRWFVQMGGAGLDSLAIERVNWQLKRKLGPLAYVWAGLQALWGHLPVVEAEVDGQLARGQLALVGNGRFYGGRWIVFPGARLDDGRLDLAMVEAVSPWRFPGQFAALARGAFARAPGLVHLQGREIVLRPAVAAGRPIPFQVEGDNLGRLPARFFVDPRGLRVVAPA